MYSLPFYDPKKAFPVPDDGCCVGYSALSSDVTGRNWSQLCPQYSVWAYDPQDPPRKLPLTWHKKLAIKSMYRECNGYKPSCCNALRNSQLNCSISSWIEYAKGTVPQLPLWEGRGANSPSSVLPYLLYHQYPIYEPPKSQSCSIEACAARSSHCCTLPDCHH